MRQTALHIPFFGFLLWMLFISIPLKAEGEDVLDRIIYMSKGKGTIYKLLGEVTDRSGFLFIYDSQLIDNDKKANIKAGNYTIRQAIQTITGDDKLGLRVVGRQHILIYRPEVTANQPETPPPAAVIPKEDVFISIEGRVQNRYTNEPIPYASVGITEEAIGVITNQNGEFRLTIPDSLRHSLIHLSHIGFMPQAIEASFLMNGHQLLSLEPKVIPLQEVIVRIVNPQKLIDEMLEKRKLNYAEQPVLHTTFYREGIEQKKELTSLTEAVFRIYKTPFDNPSRSDQVKLIKMRKIINRNEKDTLMTKFKSGINACLMLDIVKNLPDFLTSEEREYYDYIHSDITVVDDRITTVIGFEQKKGISMPLYRGELYIDSENNALVMARFEINPDYVEKTAGMYVEKKSRHLKITPQQIVYTVSYKPWNGIYYINHIRGDLHFRIKKKRKLFSSNLHTWFEMVTCKTDVTDVNRFSRNEALSTQTVFSETRFAYDESFWENFNVILPEEKLSDAISKIKAKIEETGY